MRHRQPGPPRVGRLPHIRPARVGQALAAGGAVAVVLTAGGFDTHIHFICPQQVEEALMSGVTSMLGGGTGPAG